MKTIEELMLTQLLWELRIEAYKRKFNVNAKDVADVLTEKEHSDLIFIYDWLERLKAKRLLSNPTIKKLIDKHQFCGVVSSNDA